MEIKNSVYSILPSIQQQNIGIFGGSFHPIHQGHTTIIEQLLAKKIVDYLIVVPTSRNPLKTGINFMKPQLQWEMIAACLHNKKNIFLWNHEFLTPQKSYSIDTLTLLTTHYFQKKFSLIVGEDAFSSFHLWKNPSGITQYSEILLVEREGFTHTNKHHNFPARKLDISAPYISSSAMRKNKNTMAKFLPSPAHKVYKKYC